MLNINIDLEISQWEYCHFAIQMYSFQGFLKMPQQGERTKSLNVVACPEFIDLHLSVAYRYNMEGVLLSKMFKLRLQAPYLQSEFKNDI